MKVRTRFAPSPTGYMHIGNLRTALYAYLVAKKDNGDFILRIEDTDQKRKVEGAIDVMLKGLSVYGINADEGVVGDEKEIGDYGPYYQSARVEIYQTYAKALVEHPDEVVVTQKEEGKHITLELHVAASDMGKVIGKQGRIAKAIRSVVKAASSKDNQRVDVEIV